MRVLRCQWSFFTTILPFSTSACSSVCKSGFGQAAVNEADKRAGAAESKRGPKNQIGRSVATETSKHVGKNYYEHGGERREREKARRIGFHVELVFHRRH